MTYTTGSTITTELRGRLRGELHVPGDPGYDAARGVWNGGVDHRPAAVAVCADANDVRTALLAARDRGVPVSVRAGGHDWAGRAIREGGLVIDLTAMRGVRVDPAERVAEIEGGALTADVVDAAGAHGLGLPTGAVRGVGMVGLTTAGGYGGLIGRFGLTLDNLLSAEVLLADGTLVTAGPDGDPELLWALRGGGANFGVVVSARYRLHPLGPVLGGMVMYPATWAADVLRLYREVIATAPDELTVMTGVLTGPTGDAVAFLAPTWSGDDLAAGEAAIAPLRRLGTPVLDAVGPQPYPELLRMFDAGIVPGHRYELGTRWLPELTDDAIAAWVAAAAARTSPFSLLALHRFHGAAARVHPQETAFALRHPHLLAEVIASWQPHEEPGPHRTWVEVTADALAPDALPGGYPNMLGPEESARVRLSFGSNVARLASAKLSYDPDGVLTAVGALIS